MNNFPIKDPEEVQILAFDFSKDLGTGETLTGTPVVSIAVTRGTDATPASRLLGAPAISGGVVSQTVDAGPDQVDYLFRAKCPTSLARVLVISAVLPVRSL